MVPLEIEQKYRVSSHESIEGTLLQLEAKRKPVELQRDVYLRHPCRDFAKTGEAFRLRYVNDDVVVTYKGRKESGEVKTRTEIELPLFCSTAPGWMLILETLGFTVADEVHKSRKPFEVGVDGIQLSVVCDTVEKIGKFVEIESIVHDRGEVERTQQAIIHFAQKLHLHTPEPRSYLRQIIELRDSTLT